MWPFIANAAAAFLLAVFQTAFLSRLSLAIAGISFPVIAISFCVLTDRPLTAALWALMAGVALDLHGVFGFGTETALFFLVFLCLRSLFNRVLTNASPFAVFLLAAAGVAIRFIGLAAVDGVRIIFGGTPYLISTDLETWIAPLRGMIINGLLTVLLVQAVAVFKRRLQGVFLHYER